MALTTRERDAIARLDAGAMLAQVTRWSAINSGTGNLEGLAKVGEELAAALAVLPGELAWHEPAPVTRVGPDGDARQINHGRHLTCRVRPEARVRVLLTGHMDTVYPVDHPFQVVREIAPGVVNGPGVADMKGGIAVMLAALQAIEAGGTSLGYDILINSDEETGSLSSAPLLAELAQGKAAALTYEPALPDGTLAGARGGTGNFTLVVRGRSAHAGRNPGEGRNALTAAAELALRLEAAAGDGLTVNPARIEGGGPNNVVPHLAMLHVNFRPAGPDAIARAQAALDTAVAEIAAAREVRIELHGSFNRPAKPLDTGATRLFELVRDAGSDLGLQIAWRATGGVCDGNNIAAAGIPVVDTMGVRGGAIHSAEEFLLTDSLVERAALSAVTLLRLAERGRP